MSGPTLPLDQDYFERITGWGKNNYSKLPAASRDFLLSTLASAKNSSDFDKALELLRFDTGEPQQIKNYLEHISINQPDFIGHELQLAVSNIIGDDSHSDLLAVARPKKADVEDIKFKFIAVEYICWMKNFVEDKSNDYIAAATELARVCSAILKAGRGAEMTLGALDAGNDTFCIRPFRIYINSV